MKLSTFYLMGQHVEMEAKKEENILGEAGDANVDPKDTCDDNSDYPDEILLSSST